MIDKTSPMFAWQRVVGSPQLGAHRTGDSFETLGPSDSGHTFLDRRIQPIARPLTPPTRTLFLLAVASHPYGEFAYWLAWSWIVVFANPISTRRARF